MGRLLKVLQEGVMYWAAHFLMLSVCDVGEMPTLDKAGGD